MRVSKDGKSQLMEMDQLKKYIYDAQKPLSQPYNKDGVYNAYYRAINSETNIQYLFIQYSQQRYERMLSKFKRLQKLKQVESQHIVKINTLVLDKQTKKLYLALQWCSAGCLYEYQKSNSAIDCDLATKILLDVAKGLRDIHAADQLHRNVNMENVQIDQKGVPKLGFRCLYPKTYYMSPEDINGTRGKQNDIFSLGVLFYKMISSQTLYKGNGLQEQIKLIQQGPKFPKDETKMFPLSFPIQVKNLIIGMTRFKANQRLSIYAVIEQCEQYLKKMCQTYSQQIGLSNSIVKKIFKDKFIPVFIRHKAAQQLIINAVNPQKHQITKFHIYKSKSKSSLVEYVQKVLSPYRQVKDDMQIVPIYENAIVDDEYLVIRTFYNNQGSLKEYLEHSGTVQPGNAKQFIEKLKQKLKKYGKTHNYLTSDSILLKGNTFFINYPPFLTKQYLNKLKNSKNEIDFIAPEIKQGKKSDNADSWSVAMLKYMLKKNELPQVDKNGKVVINKLGESREDIKQYEDCLQKDPTKRRGLFQAPRKPKQQVNSDLDGKSQIQQIGDQIPGPVIVQASKKKRIVLPKIQKGQRKTFGQLLSKKLYFLQFLEKHWTKPIRVGIKCIIGLIMLIFLYYLNFFLINGQLITEHSLYEAKMVEIRGFTSDATPEVDYNLVTKTPMDTYNLFYNKTLSTLRDEYRCVLNDYSVQSNVVQVINSSPFNVYQIFGILFSIFNLIIFCISLSKMDFPKVFYISKLDENNFNQIWNWIFINMALATQISFIYLLYGSLFHMKLQPCLSKASLTAVEFLLKKWNYSFNIRYIWIYLGLIFSYMVTFFFIIKPQFEVKTYLKAILVALYLAGTFSRIMGGSGDYVAWEKQSVFGKVGQLLLLIISIVYLVIDLIFGCNIKNQYAADKTVNKIADDSMAEMNATQQNFLPE